MSDENGLFTSTKSILDIKVSFLLFIYKFEQSWKFNIHISCLDPLDVIHLNTKFTFSIITQNISLRNNGPPIRRWIGKLVDLVSHLNEL